MASLDRWTTDDGTRVDWPAVAQTAVGVVVIPIVSLIVGWISLIRAAITTITGGIGGFFSDVIGGVLAIPVSVAGAAGAEVTSFITMFGPFAFPLAIVLVLISGYLLTTFIVRSVNILTGVL